jgi:hypothetical protein
VLTAVGEVTVSRPYYLCPRCRRGQFPADVELDIANTEFSPGVRRMQALVGQQAPFEQGREQMKLLAGLEVNAKAVEPPRPSAAISPPASSSRSSAPCCWPWLEATTAVVPKRSEIATASQE